MCQNILDMHAQKYFLNIHARSIREYSCVHTRQKVVSGETLLKSGPYNFELSFYETFTVVGYFDVTNRTLELDFDVALERSARSWQLRNRI